MSTTTPEEIASYTKHSDDATKVACIMIATMNPKLRRIYEDYWPYEMHKELAEKFCKQERIEMHEGYVERLRKLEMPVHEDLAIDIVLNSLPSSFDQFTLAYHLNNSQVTLDELHRMLRTAEDGMKGKMPREPSLPAFRTSRTPKKLTAFTAKKRVTGRGAPPGCDFHICSDLQGLKESRELEHGRLNLVMGNRRTSPVTKIGVYILVLSSRVCLDLHNCFYSPDMAKNIISFHALVKQEKACLWHCRLGHINKKRIAQLQRDGVLESFDLGSNDVCESCLLGKMTKSPFKGSFERGEGLLEISYAQMCVVPSEQPQNMARGSMLPLLTILVDMGISKSRISQIPLKSSEFKNEPENQLGRKIKMLRSDRGGEYLSVDFLDYL
ncbi:hypothetical protein L2E82_10196 [Cichorium intybus]|uniref:Uncharacterized protein n=1 Tax=Cichorium intybus TaxID=13427 RepID=A0ACB9G9Y8_CICIN|nr:hypothetical protein L2E82_10196 [Cichorium intybus]